MDFTHDILIPFAIGIFGIYFAYMIFHLFIELSFKAISNIKEDLKKKKTRTKKFFLIIISTITITIFILMVATFVLRDELFSKSILTKIFFGTIGYVIFVAFFNSPMHEIFNKHNNKK